jgi:hypothetical protein
MQLSWCLLFFDRMKGLRFVVCGSATLTMTVLTSPLQKFGAVTGRPVICWVFWLKRTQILAIKQ